MTWRQQGKPTKYRNRPTEYGGRKYHSKKEARFAENLDLLKLAGEVREWKPQVRYRFHFDDGQRDVVYVADFYVIYTDGTHKVYDVKGYRKGPAYDLFKLKKRLMMHFHAVDVIEV